MNFSIADYRSAALATGIAVVALTSFGCGPSKPAPPPRVQVTAVHVVARPVTLTQEYPAQLEASNTVEIRPRVSGILERQEGIEGQLVKAGQVLFVIDQQPYRAALSQAQAALAQAEAAKAQAERDLERVRPLSQLDALSQRELDAAVAAGAATTAQVRAAQAGVIGAELNLNYTVIRAPIAGTMSRALVRIGGVVTAYSTVITTLYKLDPMYVNLSIDEQRLLELQQELKGSSDPENSSNRRFHIFLGNGTELPAAADLNFVDAAVDQRTDTLPIRLSIANPQQLLRSGQYVKVSIKAAELPAAILIPQRAVQELQDKRFVWIVDSNGQAQQRDVIMGGRVGSDWVVTQGIAAGDTVITDGVQKVKPGTAVDAEPRPAPAPAPAPAPSR